VTHGAVRFALGNAAATCDDSNQGDVILDKTSGSLMVCMSKRFRPVIPVPLGSEEFTAAASCKTIKASGDSRGTRKYWVIVDKKTVEVYCNMDGDGEVAKAGSHKDVPAVSCKEINKIKEAKSGLYWVDPDGAGSFQVYCDLSFKDGGWTLMLHAEKNGCTNGKNRAEYQRNYAEWRNLGVGKLLAYGAMNDKFKYDHGSCYFMPLDQWQRVLGTKAGTGASHLMFAGGGAASGQAVHIAAGPYMAGIHNTAIKFSNNEEIRRKFCASQANCFVDARGFSTHDQVGDNYNGGCKYDNRGWWYDNCYTYNPHVQGNSNHFTGYSFISTNQWTWMAR
jgi:hypothetical protein